MARESIELCKKWDGKASAKKMQWPALMSRKLDGVPARIRNIGGHIFAYTRQNERILSIDHIVDQFKPHLLSGESVTGELYIEGLPFKDISGLARQHKPASELVWWGFDAEFKGKHPFYQARQAELAKLVNHVMDHPNIGCIPTVFVNNADEVEEYMVQLQQAYPRLEGAVIHSCAKLYRPGTRLWCTQKYKPRPTMDILWVGVEEAVDKFGVPKGMVGRCIGMYKGKEVGVGPGALTHKERTAIWNARGIFFARRRVMEVGYMPDDTYDALREPTFVRLREWNKEVSYD